jgi:hypothetical protein
VLDDEPMSSTDISFNCGNENVLGVVSVEWNLS